MGPKLKALLDALGITADFFGMREGNEWNEQNVGDVIAYLERAGRDMNLTNAWGGMPLSYGTTPIAGNLPSGPYANRFATTPSTGGLVNTQQDVSDLFKPGIPDSAYATAGDVGGLDLAQMFQLPDQSLQDVWSNTIGPSTEFRQPPMDMGQYAFDPSSLLTAGQRSAADLGQTAAGIQGGLGAAGTSIADLLGRTGATVEGTLDRAQHPVGTLANQLGLSGTSLWDQVDYPEFEGEAQLATRLGGISAAAGGQEALARQQTAGRGLAAGQSLESLGADIDAIKREIGRGAGMAGQQVASDIEGQELAHGMGQAQMQGALGQAEAQMRAGLASSEAGWSAAAQQQLAGLQAGLGTTGAGLQQGLALGGANIQSTLGQAAARGPLEAAISAGGFGVQNLGQLMQGEIANRAQDLQAQGMTADDAYRRANAEVMAASRDIEASLNAEGMRMGALQNMVLNPSLQMMGYQTGLHGQGANVMANQQHFIPQWSDAAQSITGPLYQAANQPSSPGGKVGFSLFVTYSNPSCVDGECLVPGPRGSKFLKMVEVGDEVYAADGVPTPVIAVDYGMAPESEQNTHVLLKTHIGEIRVTKDHSVCGKPAVDWEKGDLMNLADKRKAVVESVESCRYVPSGDLALEGGKDYIADGFVIQSNLTKLLERVGLDRWNKLVAEAKAQEATKEVE